MTRNEQLSISIKLSAAQIDDVLRAASRSRAPSVTTLVADALRAEYDSGRTTDPGRARDAKPGAPGARLSGYMPTGTSEARLSRSLLRGLSLLTCFGPDGEARGIVEIAQDLDMSPSTAHRYALTLVTVGLLERCPDTRKYRLPETIQPHTG